MPPNAVANHQFSSQLFGRTLAFSENPNATSCDYPAHGLYSVLVNCDIYRTIPFPLGIDNDGAVGAIRCETTL